MKRFLTVGLAILLWGTVASRATDPLYANYGLVSEPPQIDATAFLNAGVFDFSNYGGLAFGSQVPFDTQYTLFFTNRGLMSSQIGWRFDYVTDAGRFPSSVFENQQTILAQDFTSLVIGGSSSVNYSYRFANGSYLLVNATNITSSGYLATGSGGLLKLAGKNLDLSHGGISSSDASLAGSGHITTDIWSSGYEGKTNYWNPSEVTDIYWGIGVNQVLGGDGTPLYLTGGRFTPPSVTSPYHEVVETAGFTNVVSLPQIYYLTSANLGTNTALTNFAGTNYLGTNYYFVRPPAMGFAYTNQTTPSNAWVQVVFVTSNLFDTNINIRVRFLPNFFGTNGGSDVIVEYTMAEEDIVSGTIYTNYVYFTDRSMTQTNSALKANIVDITRKPSAFEVTRTTPFMWDFGVPSNTQVTPDMFYNPTFATTVVTNSYSAYAVQIGQNAVLTNTANRITYSTLFGYHENGALTDPTNYSGRVELLGLDPLTDPRSDQLDLRDARIRCEGLLTIKTKNLLPTDGTHIDAPLLSVDAGSTNQTMVVSNIFGKTVQRLKGQIAAWSSMWTNQYNSLSFSNEVGGTNITVTTNLTDVRFHVLILDHTMSARQAVVANEVAFHATNVVVADDINVMRDFQVDGQSLSLQGTLTLPGGLGYTNFPTLMNFTNNGYLYAPLLATLGGDRATPFASVVNHGLWYAGGIQTRAGEWIVETTNLDFLTPTNYAQVRGFSGAVRVIADSARVNYADIFAATDLSIAANDFMVSYAGLNAGSITRTYTGAESVLAGTLGLRVTNNLTDGGPGASNFWRVVGNLELSVLPRTGDLLGTQIENVAPTFAVLRHVWAGQNRGANPEGFLNNAALGKLILDGRNGSRFRFAGATASADHALYVDYLEFRNVATNFNTSLQIDPNMTVYFANANLPVEKLDGKLNGHLRWVRTYAGPFSGTNWVSPGGRAYRANIALLQSAEIDSDGDGIVNLLDPTPFYFDENVGLNLIVSRDALKTASVAWNALANAMNYLEYKTDLNETTWQVYTNFTQGPVTEAVTVTVPEPSTTPRIYRVRVIVP